jgi:hypothetical protein
LEGREGGLLLIRHGILYNFSASQNLQITGCCKISATYGLFGKVIHIKKAQNDEEKAK